MSEKLEQDLATLVEGVLWAWLPDIEKATRGMYTHGDVAGDVAKTVAEYVRCRDRSAA